MGAGIEIGYKAANPVQITDASLVDVGIEIFGRECYLSLIASHLCMVWELK